MSQNNLLQQYNWETQYENSQVQFPRPIPDEVISVYEVYVKEESSTGADSGNDILPSSSEHQFISGDCNDLDTAINSEMINANPTTVKYPAKDTAKYKVSEQNGGVTGDNNVLYPHPISEGPSSTTTRLIDKDDPRSRLHFVKYLKRDGKTLKIWECGICSKEFRHQYTLMRHLPTHTDERNFKCEACGKAFRQLSTLSQHKAIHSDARPYVCEFCKKTFNRVSTLISHRKTHSEHKPHKCQICGKGFHQKGNLRNHVFTHTNERPYKCELCGKGFNQMSNLVCHKVKAHAHAEKMQYVCGICGKEFPRRFSLRSHEEYKHGIKYRQSANHQPAANDANGTKNKSVRIVQLPNPERNRIVEVKNRDPIVTCERTDSIVIDKIDTKAMEMALMEGQSPFALFKPAKGIPVLVKVSPMGTQNHILTPATPEDLRMAGKMSLTPPVISSDSQGAKTFQVKVPIVANVLQKIESDGRISFIIEPPGPENEHESLVTALDSQFTYGEPPRNESSSDRRDVSDSISPPMEACNELLELAAQGGIQFVRATEDGRYEVMTNSEARELMTQNSHDVTILDREEAEAINVVNIRNNGEMVIGEQDNGMMMLDGNNQQKHISMDNIEIFEDKDIRILDSKSLDDRFADGIAFLSQPKIDDLILGQKSLGMEDGVGMADHVDQGVIPSSQQELTSLLGHRSDLPTLSNGSQSSMSSLLIKNHGAMPVLNETLPYLKSNSSLVEDFALLNGSPMDDHHSLYESKMKLSPGYDNNEPDTTLMHLNPPDLKFLGSVNHNSKFAEFHDGMYSKYSGNKCCLTPPKVFSNFNDIKPFGLRNQDPMPSQYQDVKLFSPYEQFLKSMVSNTNGYESNLLSSSNDYRTDVKVPGKKHNPGLMNSDIGGIDIDEKSKLVMTNGMEFCGTSDSGMISSIQLEPNSRSDYFFQACSPCDTDFLSFENRLKDGPSCDFERVHKDCRDTFVTSTGLPDLD